jgi:hypothetical protein
LKHLFSNFVRGHASPLAKSLAKWTIPVEMELWSPTNLILQLLNLTLWGCYYNSLHTKRELLGHSRATKSGCRLLHHHPNPRPIARAHANFLQSVVASACSHRTWYSEA